MARDPISLSAFGTKDGQLKLEFVTQITTKVISSQIQATRASLTAFGQLFSKPTPSTVPVEAGARRANKLKKINSIYEQKFQLIPFFLKDYFPLIG